MKRIGVTPRREWRRRVAEVGLVFAGPDEVYWDESVCYALSPLEVDLLEEATEALHQLCLAAVEQIIEHRRYAELGIPGSAVPLIEQSWKADAKSVYGRFDLRYDGREPPKLLEFNADTPTSLLEAGVVQWFWLRETGIGDDQFNSIHDALIATWRHLAPEMPGERLYFASGGDPEDLITTAYLRDTAEQAGLRTVQIPVAFIGWDPNRERFVDERERPLDCCFKLYPWEWMLGERFGPQLVSDGLRAEGGTRWLEPAWKMLLSNKGILPILWELFPDHPNLLPCFREPGPLGGSFARKPLLSREGANVALVERGTVLAESGGDYGAEGFVYQALAPLPNFDGAHPVFGSWVIGGEAAGVGIRESAGPITDNRSRFVPHFIL